MLNHEISGVENQCYAYLKGGAAHVLRLSAYVSNGLGIAPLFVVHGNHRSAFRLYRRITENVAKCVKNGESKRS